MTNSKTSSQDAPCVVAAVVTYNNRVLLRKCLNALQAQTHPIVEIVVVDNASRDGTAAMVEDEFPEVTLRVLEENRGVGKGFCEAIQTATDCEMGWIWMMDDDAEPRPEALEKLFATELHKRPDTVALTPQTRFPDGTLQHDHAGWYNPVKAEVEPASASAERCTEVGFGGYAGLLCRMRAIEKVGPPDPTLFFWFGDVDFCLRLAQIGRLYLVRTSVLIHHVYKKNQGAEESDSKPWRHYSLNYYWRFYYSYRNRILILYRHVAGISGRVRGTATILRKALRSAAMLCVYHRDDMIEKLGLLARGLLDGFLGRSGKRVDPDDYTD